MKLLKVLLILAVLGAVAFLALHLFGSGGRSLFESAEGLVGPKLPQATDELREEDRKELQNILDNLPTEDRNRGGGGGG